MVAINLLAWRKKQQQYAQARAKNFVLVSSFILVASVIFFYSFFNHHLEKLKQRNEIKLEQLKIIAENLPKSSKNNLLSKLIQEHKRSINVFLKLQNVSPDITITTIRYFSPTHLIEGQTHNLASLNAFVRATAWQLLEVKANSDHWNFKLKVKHHGIT